MFLVARLAATGRTITAFVTSLAPGDYKRVSTPEVTVRDHQPSPGGAQVVQPLLGN